MKNYVFYPIAMSNVFINASKKMKGTRFGKTAAGAHIAKVLPTSVASLIVFLIVGVWHGADWKYVAFGVWNGVIIMLSIIMQPLFDAALDKLHIKRERPWYALFAMFRTFLIVLVGYVFDVAPSFGEGMNTIIKFFTNQNFAQGIEQIWGLQYNGSWLDYQDYIILALGIAIMLFVSIMQERKPQITLRERMDEKPFALRFILLYLAIMAVVIFGIYGSGFNASSFVYMQF